MPRVLIIEDNRDGADSLRLLLEFFGYEVAVARTGPQGVQAASDWHPDIILSDIGLPGMNGYEVASALRHDPATARTPLVAISGYGDEETLQRAQEAGFDYFFTKPADPTDLLHLIGTETETDES